MIPTPLHVVLVDGSISDQEQLVSAFAATDDIDLSLRTRRLSEMTTQPHGEGLDLAILSLDDAGLDGLLRLREHYPQLAVIVLAGETTSELAIASLRHGSLDILSRGQLQSEVLRHAVGAALRRQKAEFHHLATSANPNHRLETVRTSVSQIAHDFNNLFCTIIGFSELLLEDMEGHPGCTDVEKIRTAGERGRILIRELMTVTRADPA